MGSGGAWGGARGGGPAMTQHRGSMSRLQYIREKADPAEEAGADILTPGPGGVLYVTANSASGSKYYSADAAGSWWLSAFNQENVRNDMAVEVTDDAISVRTIRSEAKDADRPVNSIGTLPRWRDRSSSTACALSARFATHR